MPGLGRRTFAPGEVLTATNVMGYLQDQAVMNFAGTAARGSAIGTAVSEGMVSYLQDSNSVQVYDGSAWKPIGGLVPIIPTVVTYVTGTGSVSSSGAVNFSGCSSVSLDGVFTAEYKNYRLVFTGQRSTAAAGFMFARLRTGSPAADVSSSYAGGFSGFFYNGTTAFATQSANEILFVQTFYDKFAIGVDIDQPQEATGTKVHGTSLGSGAANGFYAITGVEHNSSTSFSGITVICSGALMTGQVQIFGYND